MFKLFVRLIYINNKFWNRKESIEFALQLTLFSIEPDIQKVMSRM